MGWMQRMIGMALACLALGLGAGEPGSPLEGAWSGGITVAAEWQPAMAHFESRQGTLAGGVVILQEKLEAPARNIQVQGAKVRFEVPVKTDAMVFEGTLEGTVISGSFQHGDRKGTFELFRQLPKAQADAYTGIYEGPKGRFYWIQRWEEIGGMFIALDETGALRALVGRDATHFESGRSTMKLRPVETRFEFQLKDGRVQGLVCTPESGAAVSYRRSDAYRTEAVTFKNGDVNLGGTLYLPTRKGPHGAVVATHGSGPQQGEDNMVFLAPLLRQGLAVLVYDKRGVGKSGGNWELAGFDELAGDAVAGVELLKGRKDIDPSRIGIWGVSQGGWVAPLAAVKCPSIAGVMIVSGPAVSPVVQELTRTAGELKAEGFSDEDIEKSLALYKRMNHFVRTGEGWDAYVEARQKAVNEKWFMGAPEPPRKDNPYYTFWRKIMDHDPVAVLERLRCPILAIYGGMDPNVQADQNRPIMEAALRRGKNPDATVRVFPSGNHVLLETRDQSFKSTLESRGFAAEFLPTLLAWTDKRLAR